MYMRKTWKMLLSLGTLLFLAMLVWVMLQSYYDYEMKEVHLLERSELIRADYWMFSVSDVMDNNLIEALIEVKKLPEVDKVVCSKDSEVHGLKFDTASNCLMPMDLIQRDVFDGSIEGLDLEELKDKWIYPSAYIVYNDRASREEIAEVRERLADRGEYASVWDTIQLKKNTEIKTIKNTFVVPFVMFGIVLFLSVVISMLIADYKMPEIAVHILCGASKMQILSISIIAFGLCGMIPVGLIHIFIGNYDAIMSFLGFNYSGWYIDIGRNECISTTMIAAFMILLDSLTQVLLIARKKPIDIYGRNCE